MDGAWDSGEKETPVRAELLRKTTFNDLIRKPILPPFKLNSCKCHCFLGKNLVIIHICIYKMCICVHICFIYVSICAHIHIKQKIHIRQQKDKI